MSNDYNSKDKRSWVEKLTDRFNELMLKHDMPEDISHELETFVLTVAKEQYIAGNRGGIAWLRKQVGAGKGQILVAANAPQPTA